MPTENDQMQQKTEKEPAKITVILPTYNRRSFLPDAIRCIVNQTFPHWRLLVINDGGEPVKDIVDSFDDKRIEYFERPHEGKPSALNFGLQQVKSKYIAYMDDDDEVFPEHLQELYNAAESNQCDFVFSDTWLTVVSHDGAILSRDIENMADVASKDLRFCNKINHKQILHSKELSDKAGLYDAGLDILIDYDYIKRLAALSEPYHVHKITGNHFLRQDATGVYSSISGLWKSNLKKCGISLLKIFEKQPEDFAELYLTLLTGRSPVSPYIEMFFKRDSAASFCEENKIVRNYCYGENIVIETGTEQVRQVRLDFGSYAEPVKISGMTLVFRDGSTEDCLHDQATQFGNLLEIKSEDGDIYMPISDDPQIVSDFFDQEIVSVNITIEKAEQKYGYQALARMQEENKTIPAIQQKNAELSNLLSEQEVALSRVQAELQSTHTALQNTLIELNTIKNSTIWRTTLPLRRLLDSIKLFIRSLSIKLRNKIIMFNIFKELKIFRMWLFIKKQNDFSNEWYWGNYRDVAEHRKKSIWYKIEKSGIPGIKLIGKYMCHPLRHYLLSGADEYRNPTLTFNTLEYLTAYSDVAESRQNAYYHYLRFGLTEGRFISEEEQHGLQKRIYKALGVRPYYISKADESKQLFSGKKVAIHLHLYYIDMVAYIIRYLSNIPVRFDLFISSPHDLSKEIRQLFLSSIPNIGNLQIKQSVNRGRDIAPFLDFVKTAVTYDYVAHIHTKKSPHDRHLAKWCEYLYNSLLGSKEKVSAILNLLTKDAKIVYPASYMPLTDPTGWGENMFNAEKLLRSRNLKYSTADFPITLYPAGSMFWCKGEALKEFCNLDLQYSDFEEEPIDPDGTLAHAIERLILILMSDIPQYAYCLYSQDVPWDKPYYEGKQIDFSKQKRRYENVKVLSYYLPQFHPTPENDAWHGKGFTEWTNTTSVSPLFYGHNQQRIPHDDIGFYMLDNVEILHKQTLMMKKSGVYGQIFYHYWFSGRLILEKPSQMLFAHPEIEMPFCFCWANENWTKCWDGNETDVLLEQKYSAEDAIAFIRYLLPFFKDRRYIKVGGRPVLFIYRCTSFPDFQVYKDIWDDECEKNGIASPYLVATLTRGTTSPVPYNMDAAVERVLQDWTGGNVDDERHKLMQYVPMTGSALDYGKVAEYYMNAPIPSGFTYFRSIVPAWDNTARYKEAAFLLKNEKLEDFERWFENVVQYSEKTLLPEECFVVVNAWNEWAEGAYLEPDKRVGYAYLNTIGRVLTGQYQHKNKIALKKTTKVLLFLGSNVQKTLEKDSVLSKKFMTHLKASDLFEKCDVRICSNDKEMGDFDYKIYFGEVVICKKNSLSAMIAALENNPGSVIVGNVINKCRTIKTTKTYALEDFNQIKLCEVHAWPNDCVCNMKIEPEAQFFLQKNGTSEKNKDVVSVIMRFHTRGNMALLENALYSLNCQDNVIVQPHLCLQEVTAEQKQEIRKILTTLHWDAAPKIHEYNAAGDLSDLRNVMLVETLKKVETRFAAFLDSDDILYHYAYDYLLSRLYNTEKSVTFGHIYQTLFSLKQNIAVERRRFYEYGKNYNDFYSNNISPIHGFMLNLENIDPAALHYRPEMKFLEDYYMLLQIINEDNTDWESLKDTFYIGDYNCFVDGTNTLAGNKTVTEWLKDPEYAKCYKYIEELKLKISTR